MTADTVRFCVRFAELFGRLRCVAKGMEHGEVEEMKKQKWNAAINAAAKAMYHKGDWPSDKRPKGLKFTNHHAVPNQSAKLIA